MFWKNVSAWEEKVEANLKKSSVVTTSVFKYFQIASFEFYIWAHSNGIIKCLCMPAVGGPLGGRAVRHRTPCTLWFVPAGQRMFSLRSSVTFWSLDLTWLVVWKMVLCITKMHRGIKKKKDMEKWLLWKFPWHCTTYGKALIWWVPSGCWDPSLPFLLY